MYRVILVVGNKLLLPVSYYSYTATYRILLGQTEIGQIWLAAMGDRAEL